ncbi:hypothetical protein KD4_30230 [Yersinia pseudotuberculosis]
MNLFITPPTTEIEYVDGIIRALEAYDSDILPSYIYLNQTHRVQVYKDTVWQPVARSLKVAALTH